MAPEYIQTTHNVTDSAAAVAAAKLREEILSGVEPGSFLGSEDDLLARLGVSRPTLRQAARILEHEDLLTVRRGKKGGLFARLPTSDTLAHIASVVLRAHGVTFEDITRVNAIVGAQAARLAAEHAPERDRRSLHELALEQLGDESNGDHTGGPAVIQLCGESAGDPPGRPGETTGENIGETTDLTTCAGQTRGREVSGGVAEEVAGSRAVLDTVLEVNRRLAALSGSPTLAMFGSVLAELAHANLEVRMFTDPERIASTRHYIRALTAAVANSDADEAAELVERHHDRLLVWMRRPQPRPSGG